VSSRQGQPVSPFARRKSRRAAGLCLLGFAGLLAQAPALASDYGCRVLLCLANPAGPTAVAQCVPPITQLWRDLAHVPPRPFPTCDEARPAYAAQNMTYYDPCPDGTSALDVGVLALQQGAPDGAPPEVGIGDSDGLTAPSGDGVLLGRKVCVGRRVGQAWVFTGRGDNSWSGYVDVYDRIAILDPATSPNVIDVYLNNALYRRVRW
jgi:hypothetical protein